MKIATPMKGYRLDKKTGKLVKIDKRNLIQKLQGDKKVRVGKAGAHANGGGD